MIVIPFQSNYTVNQGSTFNQVYQLLDAYELPFNLAGYTARLQCRPFVDSDQVFFDLTTENGGITITPSLGLISVDMDADQTAALNFNMVAVYDLELYHGDIVQRFTFGNVTLSLEVTRP